MNTSRWTRFKQSWLSWLTPIASAEGHFIFRGRFLVRHEMYCAAVEANNLLLAQKESLRAQRDEAKALLEKYEAKYEAACIVNHLQRQKQVAYERSVYAASMGGMILDNQEEIARIAAEVSRHKVKELGGI